MVVLLQALNLYSLLKLFKCYKSNYMLNYHNFMPLNDMNWSKPYSVSLTLCNEWRSLYFTVLKSADHINVLTEQVSIIFNTRFTRVSRVVPNIYFQISVKHLQ